jgi:UDP-N-acetylmuramate-alanine ligase
MREFGEALAAADEIVLTDIYSAGEPPIPGVTVEALLASVRTAARCPVHLVKAIDDVPRAVAVDRWHRRPHPRGDPRAGSNCEHGR